MHIDQLINVSFANENNYYFDNRLRWSAERSLTMSGLFKGLAKIWPKLAYFMNKYLHCELEVHRPKARF